MGAATDCGGGPRIVIALDYPSAEEALAMAGRLDPVRCRVKVGMELFTAAGPGILDGLHGLGFEIFLDLKFHDIPNTVAGACRAAAARGVWMMNVHACGGRRMLEAARDAAGDGNHRPLVIAVTVPTSMEASDLVETQRRLDFQSREPVPTSMEAGDRVETLTTNALSERVRSLEQLSRECRLDGIVCSAADLECLPAGGEPGFIRVTPGIRFESGVDDQRRVMAPGDAVRAGADYLVIGRPITRAPDPIAALEAVEGDIAARGG